MATREQVIAEARKWIGTPYHHAANVLGHGVDCGMMMIEVYSAVGLCEWFDPRPYSRTFHLHQRNEWYDAYCNMKLNPVESPLPGDMALFKIGRLYAHGAIVVDWPTIIHAHAFEGMVLESDISRGYLRSREVKFYSPWSA